MQKAVSKKCHTKNLKYLNFSWLVIEKKYHDRTMTFQYIRRELSVKQDKD